MTTSVANRYRPVSCIWELTLLCNMKCLHCGSSAGRARRNELTLNECLNVADELIELGCKETTFIGGEVFFYPGWEKIARHMSDSDVLVNIMTNGYKIKHKHMQQIKYARLSNVGVSIDGMEKNHNKVRRRHNGFAEAAKTLDLLRAEKIPSGVVTVLFDFNLVDLEEMYAFLVEKDVEVWQLQLAHPMGNLRRQDGWVIRPQNIPSIIEFIREMNRKHQMVVVAADSIGYFDENESYIRGRRFAISCWEGCQAGLTSVALDSVGNVKGCGALYSDIFIEGNVRERPLSDIWHDDSSFAYNRKFDVKMLTGVCEGCDVGSTCRGGCRASNYFNLGSLYESRFCTRKQLI